MSYVVSFRGFVGTRFAEEMFLVCSFLLCFLLVSHASLFNFRIFIVHVYIVALFLCRAVNVYIDTLRHRYTGTLPHDKFDS